MTTNSTHTKPTIQKWFLLFMMIVGLIAGGFLVRERIHLENQENHIEMIVNYETALRYASYEKKDTDVYAEMRAAGITALAIYDKTLQKMADAGEIVLLRGENASDIHFYDAKGIAMPGKTYVLPVAGKYPYFQETWEALTHRLGESQVGVRQTDRGIALELSQPYQSLIDMNLTISRLEAQDAIAHGFHVIARPTNFKDETRADVDLVLNRLQGLNGVTGIVFVGKEVLGYPNDVSYAVERLKDMHIPILGIEATTQLQYEPQLGFYEMAKQEHYEVGRLYTIPKDYLKKLEPDRVAQMFYITDIERNVRFNLLPLFEEGKNNQTALQTSFGYMKELKSKLESRGFVLGKGSIYPAYYPNSIALQLTMLGALALMVWTLQAIVPMRYKTQMLCFFLSVFILGIGYQLTSGITVRLLVALGAAVCAPTSAIILVMDCWKKRYLPTHPSFMRSLGAGVLYSVAAALLASIGGIYIAAILGSNDFFMEFSIFRGVKFTFVLPVILTAIAYLQRFPLWKGKTLGSRADWNQFIYQVLRSDVKVYTIFIFFAFLVAAWVFVGRSGHTEGVPVPQFEIAMRHFLETYLYARPREKEFLIGYPAMLFAVYALYHRWPQVWHFVFTIGAVIGLGSMVETFAHIRTPVWMSIVRGFNGVWAGLLVGLVLLIGYQILLALYRRIQGKEEMHA